MKPEQGITTMTTNKQHVRRYVDIGLGQICPINNMRESADGDYILYKDYEALQAELEREIQRRFDGNRAASREHREEVTELLESLAICTSELRYRRHRQEALQNQLNKIQDIANETLEVYRKGCE